MEARTDAPLNLDALRSLAGLARYDRDHPGRPTLVFCTSRTSGPARRMDSLIAHLANTERERVRVVPVDAQACPHLVERLGVTEIPTLVLVRDGIEIGRAVGRVSGHQIRDLLLRLEPDRAASASTTKGDAPWVPATRAETRTTRHSP